MGPIGYARGVRAELKKVSYPTPVEIRNYSTVVIATLLFMMALIFGLDYAFGEGATFLFK
jgi:preprotein translocase subunit SecE